MNKKRIQLTLFITGPAAAQIETVRKKYNPLQYELIKAHVTLCREDELVPIEKVMENLAALKYGPITIRFEKPIRFSENKGVLLPAAGNTENFQQLRKLILKDVVKEPRVHEPHITLIHPRNSTCTDDIFHQIENTGFPNVIAFDSISLIEEGSGKQWHTLKKIELKKS